MSSQRKQRSSRTRLRLDDRSSDIPRSLGGLWPIAAVCGVALGVVLIQVVYGIVVFKYIDDNHIDKAMAVRGQFGDLFGGVNALFTGLAFAGVIFTILLQRNELQLQRKELDRSTKAQIEQAAHLEEAAELSAISTLVNAYDTALKPWWDAYNGFRNQIIYLKLDLNDPKKSESEKAEARAELQQVQDNIRIQEEPWSGTLQKHQELIEKLETVISERSQGNGAGQKTE